MLLSSHRRTFTQCLVEIAQTDHDTAHMNDIEFSIEVLQALVYVINFECQIFGEIGRIKSVLTMVGGKVVYAAAPFENAASESGEASPPASSLRAKRSNPEAAK